MPVPANKKELKEAIRKNYDKLRKDLASVPHETVREKSLEGHARGSLMSASDLVAYLIGWNFKLGTWNLELEI